MKNAVRVLAVILVLVSIVSVIGCSSGSDKNSFINMVNMLPEDLGQLTFFDVAVLRADEELASTWDLIQQQLIGPDIYGENVSKITVLGLSGSNNSMMLYKGDFDLEQMTSLIEQGSVESFEYEGITVWTDQNASSTAVIDNVVFVGSSEDIQLCIDVANGQEKSIYDSKDIQDIIGRLPGGYELGASIMGNSTEGGYGLLAVGYATGREGNNSVATQVGKFEDSTTAEQFMTAMASQISPEVEVVQKGQFITMTLISEIPSPEEGAYDSTYNDLQNAVVAYATDSNGVFPTINGTVNISGYDLQIVDICSLLTSEGGMLSEVPDGVASINGSNNDNCDAGCDGCLDTNHYIWAVDEYDGYVYSICVGANCSEYNTYGYQGVWP
jgi:hypothetical protein